MDGRILTIAVFLFVVMVAAKNGISVHEDARGSEFVFAFPTQSHPPRDYEPSLQITSVSDTTVSINISFPYLDDDDTIVTEVLPGQFIIVDLPQEVMAVPKEHYQRGTVFVQTDGDIFVVAIAYIESAPNLASFNILPTSALNREYVIVDWPSSADYYRAEFVITSLHDETNIRYILTSTPIIPGSPREAVIQLQRYETVQFQVDKTTGRSLSGSRIWSDKPISIVAGCECADVPLLPITSCDYVAVHLIPFEKWGLFYSLAPFGGRERSGYFVRIVAGRDDTLVTIGNSYGQILLNAGKVYEQRILTENIITIAGTKPIFVVQYAPSHHIDDVGDSLMLIVPPIEQYINEVISFAVFDSTAYRIEADYISIHTECDNIDDLLLDGLPLDDSWKMLRDDDAIMCAAQNTINSSQSVYNISHLSSDARISAMLYGFGKSLNAVSYGHAAGFGLENITCTVFDDDTNSTEEVLCLIVGPVDIRCANNATGYTEPGEKYGLVSWPPVTANGSSGYISVTCDHRNGGKFDLGHTRVVCVATEFGHARANCSFQVTVIDIESPVITDCPSDKCDFAFENDKVPIDWEEPHCEDNSGECNLTTDSQPGDMFSFGDATVSYLANDGSNNEASCNFTVTIIPRCRPGETNTPGVGNFTWPDATVGETVESIEKCPISTINRGLGYGKRTCDHDTVKGALYKLPVFESVDEPCGSEDGDLDVDELAKVFHTPVAESNVEEVAEALVNVTNNQDSATTAEITSVSTTIQNIVSVGSASSEVTSSVINTVDNLLIATSEPPQENKTQASNSSSQIIRSLEKQIALTLLEEGPVKVVNRSIAVQSLPVNETTSKLGLGFFTTSSTLIDLEIEDVSTFVNQSHTATDKMIQSSISLPSSLMSEDPSGVNVSFLVFQHDTLFVSQNLFQSDDMDLVGAVISADVYGVNTSNLTEPVRIELFPFKRCITESNVNSTRCVTWDFTLRDGIGDWSEEGCEFVEFKDGRVVCQCYHLTNFAAIAGKSIRSTPLDIISIVGCSLSLASVTIMLGIFLYFRKLRQSQPRQIIIQLCISLFCLYLTYIVLFSIDKHSSYDPKCPIEPATWQCRTLAVFLHYFTLTTLMWMGVEAQMLYRLLVIVFGQGSSSSFFKYACMCAWGIPMIIASITLGVGWNDYKHLKNCFISDGLLYLSLAIPIALVLGHNLVVFILVLRSLLKSRAEGNVKKDKSPELWRRLRQAICITLLLGLTWVFGIFAIKSAEEFFSWLFVLFNAVQGTCIFIVFCVLQDDVRMTLAPYFKWAKVPEFSAFSRSPSTVEESQSGYRERYISHSDVSADIARFNPTSTDSKSDGVATDGAGGASPSNLTSIEEELPSKPTAKGEYDNDPQTQTSPSLDLESPHDSTPKDENNTYIENAKSTTLEDELSSNSTSKGEEDKPTNYLILKQDDIFNEDDDVSSL
ncbi:uncharacterized protein [Amphiura filiformis]|uniref:uncharacterized protein n=1 Tax=Amphiura filiformis TaxID=82378 RepID=UPI003B2276ED